MRVVNDISVPYNEDTKFPFGSIKNETPTEQGTPVVEEIYGDILTNNYKMLQEVGITPTGTQDSDTSQYQILEALKLLPNSLNDIEQVLSLTATTWDVPFNLTYLPDKYHFVARAAENYVAGVVYDFKGTGVATYPFLSSGFNGGDLILVTIDVSGVRAYSLSALSGASVDVLTPLGTPVSYNDTNNMFYFDSGSLMSDTPSIDYLQSIIRVDLADGTIVLNDVFVVGGMVLCFCLIPATNDYIFREFDISDLSVSTPVSIDISLANATDYVPYAYFDGTNMYLSNSANGVINDFDFKQFNYTAGSLISVSSFSIDSSFVKTTNAVIKNGLLYTLINGELNSFNLTTGAKISVDTYPGISGNIFIFNSEVYFGSGEVAKKWII